MSAIPCPAVISAYNKAMGGTDLSDMPIYLYKTPMKSKQWYLPLFGYTLDLSICNAWLVYRSACTLLDEKPLLLKRFRLSVAAHWRQSTNQQILNNHWLSAGDIGAPDLNQEHLSPHLMATMMATVTGLSSLTSRPDARCITLEVFKVPWWTVVTMALTWITRT